MTSHDSTLPLFSDASGIPAPIAAIKEVLISALRVGAMVAGVFVVEGLVGEEESPLPQLIDEISKMAITSGVAIRIGVVLVKRGGTENPTYSLADGALGGMFKSEQAGASAQVRPLSGQRHRRCTKAAP